MENKGISKDKSSKDESVEGNEFPIGGSRSSELSDSESIISVSISSYSNLYLFIYDKLF